MKKVYRSALLEADVKSLGEVVLCKTAGVDATDAAARTQAFIMSTGKADHEGDIIEVAGWDLAVYKANPVVLFDHDQRFPIGKSLDTYLTSTELRTLAWFAPSDISEFADTIFKMVKAGILKGASVGFLPLEYSFAADRQGASPFMQPMNVKRARLLECSVVSVPCNSESLADGKSFDIKGIDWNLYNLWAEQALDENTSITPRKSLESAYSVTKSLAGIARHAVSKGVLPFKKTPLADKDTPWDGPAEVKAATTDDLKIMCAWVDDDAEPDAKSAYKLPHHQAAAPHKLVFKGVVAAMGALNGGRGGLNVPEADRPKIYSHLAKSYRAFDVEPPELKSFDSLVTEVESLMKIKGHMLSKKNQGFLDDAMAHSKAAQDSHKKAYKALKSMMDNHAAAAEADDDEDDEEPAEKPKAKEVAQVNTPEKPANANNAHEGGGSDPSTGQPSTSSGVKGLSLADVSLDDLNKAMGLVAERLVQAGIDRAKGKA